jgi:translation initiation factor IF-3
VEIYPVTGIRWQCYNLQNYENSFYFLVHTLKFSVFFNRIDLWRWVITITKQGPSRGSDGKPQRASDTAAGQSAQNQPSKSAGPRVNEQIRSPEIRLIGEDGHQYGVVTIHQARLIAEDAGVDLIEVSPGSNPPVVKLMDFGKYKYQLQKKAAEAKKKQSVVLVKEIKLRPNIDKHDLDVKLRSIKNFFEDGDKVKISMQFRGRELSHQDLCREQFELIIKKITELGGILESKTGLMGNRMIALFISDKKK